MASKTSLRNRSAAFLLLAALLALLSGTSSAGDWPQFGYDAGRGSVSPDALPETLALEWVRELPAPRSAWPDSQPWLQFDLSYTPVAADGLLFVPSMITDSVTAYDTKTGEQRWSYYTDGPVRLAPVYSQGKLYFGSDDGYLYCVEAATGRYLWRFRACPTDRKLLGNERLISTWPIRGGPVLRDGVIYTTASIWPFMGIFVHAMDVEQRKVLWTNSGEGSRYQTHPHESPAFGSLVPRGHLAATDDGLLVPGGRTPPGCYDLATGELRYFHYSKRGGRSAFVSARGPWFFQNDTAFAIADGKSIQSLPATLHSERKIIYGLKDGKLTAHAITTEPSTVETTDRKGKKVKQPGPAAKLLGTLDATDVPGRLFIKAGSRFYCGQEGTVAAVVANQSSKSAKVVWRETIEGTPWNMLAADDRLFVVTVEGTIYCFGPASGEPKTYAAPAVPAESEPNPWQGTAKSILGATRVQDGYCVLAGVGTGKLAEALIAESNLHVIAIDPSAARVEAFRQRMTDVGLYGRRVSAHVGDPFDYPLPPYLADLVICAHEGALKPERIDKILKRTFRMLRPYGGVACLRTPATKLEEPLTTAELEGARLRAAGTTWSMLAREGALPGAADWTHQYADAGNSIVSRDARVKTPLGLLWFGNGPPNDQVLPRHGHGPSPQVAAGRLVIEGADMLRAIDIYTGRLLWQREMPGLGTYYDNTEHFPGADEIGSNYVTVADAVYVLQGDAIHRLDPATGVTKHEFRLPADGNGASPNFGSLAVSGDLLVATSAPVTVEGVGGKVLGSSKFKGFLSASHASRKPASGAPTRLATQPMLKQNDTWRYLADSDPSDEWTSVDYDDSAWKTGEAGFGYGDDDDRTLVECGTRMYIRKQFDASAAQGAKEMALMINYDDGFIAYLNGQEVARGAVTSGRGEGAKVKLHEAEGFERFPIRNFRSLLRPGKNVFAMEGHNEKVASSDFSLDPYVVVGREGGPQPVPDASVVQEMLKPAAQSSASRRLVALDRHTGDVRWERSAKYGFRHNNIAIGGDMVYCIDGLSKAKLDALKRRGRDFDYRPQLMALDAATGEIVWSSDEDVFGTFLNYSAEHDILLQSGSLSRDRAADEAAAGMIAYQGSDGTVLWMDLQRTVLGPCLLHGDRIICQGPAFSLLTGERVTRIHPLTGAELPWEFTRNYGCNTAVASQHMLTFRSAAAGYYDLEHDGGTGNFGGFKSSCTSNLIMAGGLLNAPEYTRTCTCNYQNQTSLAMFHDPTVETWTFNSLEWDGSPVRRVGINLGAPGDRLADNGTLWLDYPSEGGPSPDLPVEISGKVDYFRHHSSRVRVLPNRKGLNWVAASGATGVKRVTITLAQGQPKPRNYTVRLHFAELDDAGPGERTFKVLLQGEEVVDGLDIVKEASRRTALVKQFDGVAVSDRLEVTLVPEGDAAHPPVLCGIEVVAEAW